MRQTPLLRSGLRSASAALFLAVGGTIASAQITLPVNQSFAAAGSAAFRIDNPSTTASSTAINGNANGGTGIVFGVRGTSSSTEGRGVIGVATSLIGINYGVVGENTSPLGRGVYGLCTAVGGGSVGVLGESRSIGGRGVVGFAVAASGPSIGVYGETFSPAGFAIQGRAVGSGTGIRAESTAGLSLDVVGTSNFSGNSVFQTTGIFGGMLTLNGATALDVNGTATFDGNTTFNADIALAANRSIFCNGVMGIGGTALNLRLGDSADDTITVRGTLNLPDATLALGDADENQTISFFNLDTVADRADGSIRWDNNLGISACGTLGPINSGFVWDIAENTNTGWLFSNGTDYEFKVGSIGDVEMDGSFTQNGTCDLAEAFLGPADLEAGTVVVLDPRTPEAVRIATSAYEIGLAGVVSTRPGILMRGPTADAYPLIKELDSLLKLREQNALPAAQLDQQISELESSFDAWTRGDVAVALVGRVPVKVDASYGAIRPGDALTSSPTAGHAMKATEPGMIIGTAINGFEAGRGEVLVFLHVGYWAPRDAQPPQGAASGVIAALGETVLAAEREALRAENAALLERISRLEAAVERLAIGGR